MEENTEQKILEAAIEVFITKGYAKATTKEIATKAGVTKAMLHYYYRTKGLLFRMIIERTMGEIIPKFAKAIESEGTVVEKLEFIINTYIQTLRENPHLPTFMLYELSQNTEEFVVEIKSKLSHFPNFQLFFLQMMEEMKEGKIRTYNPMHLLMNVISLCVFPFAARPVFKTLMDMPDELFDVMMQEREKEVISFVKNALTP